MRAFVPLCLYKQVSSAPVADLVSGEVLESLKSAGGGVQGNGGLLITFLLDEWQSPIIAPEVSVHTHTHT